MRAPRQSAARIASEELWVVVASLADWMANSSPSWAAHCVLMAWRLVALDKRSGKHPVRIGETFRRSLAKIVIRAAGDSAKMTCGNLQLCAGLKAGIEVTTHACGKAETQQVKGETELGVAKEI